MSFSFSLTSSSLFKQDTCKHCWRGGGGRVDGAGGGVEEVVTLKHEKNPRSLILVLSTADEY